MVEAVRYSACAEHKRQVKKQSRSSEAGGFVYSGNTENAILLKLDTDIAPNIDMTLDIQKVLINR